MRLFPSAPRLVPVLLSGALLAACGDQPAAVTEPPTPAAVLAELRCSADVRAGTVSCEPASGGAASAGGASRALVTVGGQGRFVRLASTSPFHDAVNDEFSISVTVQNLLVPAMATENGTTPDAAGVRIFFATPPSNGVTVANEDGTDTFTQSGQDYFQYSGAALGADGILASGEVSTARPWRFTLGGASSFTFAVYVQARVPDGVPYTVRFTQVSGGNDHSCALTAAGQAYCWGFAGNGRLGNGVNTGFRSVPTPVDMPPGVTFTSISAGTTHTCAVASSGDGYCWGDDGQGQLGNGTALSGAAPRPSRVSLPPGVAVAVIEASNFQSCAITTGGQAYCWGDDSAGQLGNGDVLTADQPSPSAVVMPPGVAFDTVSGEGYVHCALTTQGAGYCWGDNSDGQLGTGAAGPDQRTPVAVAMPEGVTFASISVGANHTCALGSNAVPYCWGRDTFGQVGDDAAITHRGAPVAVAMPGGGGATVVASGGDHTCALGTGGNAFCWGNNTSGQVGNGTTGYGVYTPVPVSMPAGVTFTGLEAGRFHNCALSASGTYCWGVNSVRNLGDGTSTIRLTPVVVAATR